MFSFWASIALAVSLTAYKAVAFIHNVILAKRTGLPYVFSPIHELENWAYITNAYFRWRYNDYLLKGDGWPKHARYMIKDWMYEDKYRAHSELGDVFLVVAPGGLVCYTADAKMAMDVCTRRKDFVKPREKMKLIEPFGPNVVSSEGNLWRMHIRITSPPFGDAANQLVWSETHNQTEFLMKSWAEKGSSAMKSDIYLLGVNVMACAGFGKQFDWTDDKNAVPPGHSLTLINAIFQVIMFLPHILLLPKWLLKRSPWKAGFHAYVEFASYINEFTRAEKQRIAANSNYENKLKGNLLTALLKTNAGEAKSSGPRGVNRTMLTDEEIAGNMFMFLMAGYDTTANTIIYACVNLVLYPDIQDQVIEEIDRVYGQVSAEGRTELSYSKDFTKFRYLLAFLYEVLRVYPVVLPIGRITLQEQSITVSTGSLSQPSGLSAAEQDRTYILPRRCGVIVNNTSIHHNERFWPHAHILEPRRWLAPRPNLYDPLSPHHSSHHIDHYDLDPGHSNASNALDNDPSRLPASDTVKGTFMTFSEGARACLGRRFAQAEFVAFFAHLLRRHRLHLGDGHKSRDEIEHAFRSRSAGSPVTLAPPEDVKVVLRPR